MTVIETTALSKVYGRTVAVDRLDLSVERGEVLGFLGPNGAGKTTTVNMLLGLAHPTSGQARILDRPPGDPAAMARLGFLPEHFSFHPWLTALEFLDLHGRLYAMPPERRRQRIPRLLEQVGLARWGHTRLEKFSKGMLQRIGLAQALLNEPELVILDEPTSGLDPMGRREVRFLIRELRGAGVTIFLNSHLLGEVEAACDRVVIIKQGRVIRTGTLEELAGQTVEIQVRATGLTPDLLEGLTRWGSLSAVETDRLTLVVADENALPAVAQWLVSGGAQLYELSPRRLSLEELFVRAMDETP
ncbi:MAG: ABC transporter ATP-binding protein [Chloroflexia bacterium]|nr:ABC transporter ATP-binding protein [Chloroflexia bacterium]